MLKNHCDEKARWELHKNTVRCLEQILEVALHETTAVRPPTSHLTNHINKTNKRCGVLLDKERRTYERRFFLHMDMLMLVHQQKLTYISSVQTRDLPGVMHDRDRWQERIRELSVT